MLSRDQRLPSVTFPPLLRRGIRVRTDSLDFLYQKQQADKRFACIVSAKVEKLAVRRNRIRRLVHAALQSLIPVMTSGVHGIFVIRRKMSVSQDDMTTLVRLLLEKAGAI